MRKLLLPLILVSSAQAKPLPKTKIEFEKTQLLDRYISEGVSVGDIDNDGKLDIISGNLWWKGPHFKESFSFGPVKFFNIEGAGLAGYSTNFFTFPGYISEDKWLDVIKVGLPGDNSQWVKNPGASPYKSDNTEHSCQHCDAQGNVCNESPQFLDVLKGGKPELLAFSHSHITLAIPHADETKAWSVLPITPKDGRFQKYTHGLGAGDINGDGLTDVLEKAGWWQQPKNWDKTTPWEFHPFAFAPAQGGAQMFAYDIDGDGDNDVVTALNAHKYGLAWYEQIKKGNTISFKAHTVMTDKPDGNPYGVCFSQPHAMAAADIDGDGIKDIITGKCFYAHNGKDPGAKDPAVLYWFRTTRHSNGSAELVPYQIDDDSGVGRQLTTADLNGDGKMDIITSNKKGVFVFKQK